MGSVDFALSATIFVIMVAYLFLAASGTTNTVFYDTQQYDEEMAAYNIALHLLESTGTPSLWDHNLEEFPKVLGLASAELQDEPSEFVGIALDAGKIARIDPTLNNEDLNLHYPYLYVPYSVAKSLIPTIDKDYHFSIEIVGINEVKAHATLQGANLKVKSVVSSQENGLEGAIVWTYILDPEGELLDYSKLTTNAIGETPVIGVDLPRPGAFVVVTIAKRGLNYAYDYKIINYNSVRELRVIAFAQPHTHLGTGLILQYLAVNPEAGLTRGHFFTVQDANATVLFMGGDTETVQLEGNGPLLRGKYTQRTREPQVIVTRAEVDLNQTRAYGVGITAVPLILGDSHHPVYSQIVLTAINTYVVKRLVTIQGIPMIIKIKLWKGSI
ncbi:MAG: hypothetical protein ACE5R6_03510 [Candidatus Heimdallarchaeota archaeon]